MCVTNTIKEVKGMKVLKVKDPKSRERIEKKLLRERKVVGVVSNVKDISSDFVKKADVIIVDESFGKEAISTTN